jgi:hypothetical protein
MHRRMRRAALAFNAAAVVAIAGGVTHALADIGGQCFRDLSAAPAMAVRSLGSPTTLSVVS